MKEHKKPILLIRESVNPFINQYRLESLWAFQRQAIAVVKNAWHLMIAVINTSLF